MEKPLVKKWVRYTLAALGVLVGAFLIFIWMVKQALPHPPRNAPKCDALNLKSAIVMFQADNQRFPDLTKSGTAPAAGDDLVLSPDQYRELVLILRGQSTHDNKRQRPYLPLARYFETADQYKCKLAKGYKKAKTEAPFYVILDINDDGIDLGGGRKIAEPALVFWVDPAVLPGTKASAINWTTVENEGFELPPPATVPTKPEERKTPN